MDKHDVTEREADANALQGLRTQVEALTAIAEGRIAHRYMGDCPDELDGYDLRDPDCPACAVLGGSGE